MTTTEVLRETATGYLTTTLTVSAGGEHTLVRRAGADRPQRPAPSSAHLAQVAQAVGSACRTSPGQSLGGGWRHPVPGPASLAPLLTAGMLDAPLLRLCGSVGTLLAEVHATAPREPLDEPSGLGRLRAWSAAGPRAAGQALDVVADELGADGLAALLADLDTAAAGTRATTLLGAPGSQAVYPDPGGGPPTVLVTDEMACGAPAWDLGWFVGELVERSLGAPDAGDALERAARQLLRAHAETAGTQTSPQHVADAAAARILVHVHDYASYVGWHDSLRERVQTVARLRAAPGRGPAAGTDRGVTRGAAWFTPAPAGTGASPPTSVAPSTTSSTTPTHEHQEST